MEYFALFKGETRIGNTRHRAGLCWADARLHHAVVPITGDEQLLNGISPTLVDKNGSWGLLAGYSIRSVSPAKAN